MSLGLVPPIRPPCYSLMILLEIKPFPYNDLENFYKDIYEDDEIIISTWSSTLNVNHYRWFHDYINQLSSNYKVKHLVQIIQHMFKFLLLLALIVT
jgi:hypothetical protein